MDGDHVTLEKSRGRKESIELDRMAALIWRVCDGNHSMDELAGMFAEAYPDASDVAGEVMEVVDRLLQLEFLVIDGGEAALSGAASPDGEPAVVEHVVPGVELQWQLEQMRRFLFGVLRVEETESLHSDIDALLGEGALVRAKQSDVDAASQERDSCVIRYQGSMKSPSFKACVDAIICELEALIPDSAGKLELSGNAIYLRGAHMGWHSNHSRSDRRIYCSWAERPKSNFFRYEHPLSGEIVTEWEQPGWNIKVFTIPPRPARFWHCIGAASLRLSIGFRYSIDGNDGC